MLVNRSPHPIKLVKAKPKAATASMKLVLPELPRPNLEVPWHLSSDERATEIERHLDRLYATLNFATLNFEEVAEPSGHAYISTTMKLVNGRLTQIKFQNVD